MLSEAVKTALSNALQGNVAFDEPMRRRTTLKLGGTADAFCTPESVAALQALIRICGEHQVPIVSVGAGSNLLVRDGGIRGVVLATRNLRTIERIGTTGIRVECGVSTGKLLSKAIEWELGGAEFLGGVPGSVGGGLVMNAGTTLGEFVNITETVTTVHLSTAEIATRTNAECKFEYRRSALPKDEVVVVASLALAPRERDLIKADVRELRDRRNEREPKGVSNSGSTFKNPPGDYAGRLIESAGLKGTRVGGAECSPQHANWLVNTGSATASELLELIELVRTKVREVHGVALELEVKVIGENP